MNRRIFLLCLLPLAGCGGSAVSLPPPTDLSREVTIKQGVWGRILFLQGSFFPNDPNSQGSTNPVSRRIYFFPAVNYKDAITDFNNVFYLGLPGTPVRIVESRADGFFQAALPPGRYTMVTREEGGYWANLIEDNEINPVTVTANQVGEVEFKITYEASF